MSNSNCVYNVSVSEISSHTGRKSRRFQAHLCLTSLWRWYLSNFDTVHTSTVQTDRLIVIATYNCTKLNIKIIVTSHLSRCKLKDTGLTLQSPRSVVNTGWICLLFPKAATYGIHVHFLEVISRYLALTLLVNDVYTDAITSMSMAGVMCRLLSAT